MSTTLRGVVLVSWLALGAGCASGGAGGPLQLKEIGDQVAFVGSPLTLVLEARSSRGGPLEFHFDSDVPDMCRMGTCRANIEPGVEGVGNFRWTPQPEDVGIWTFTFEVTDGIEVESEQISLEVRSSIGYAGVPRFIQPLGTGTTIDTTAGDCFEFDVVVDDPDSRGVELTIEPPVPAGATLEVHDDFTATFRWCPPPESLGSSHHRLVINAADGDNEPSRKTYLLVIKRTEKPGCEDVTRPIIDHTPESFTGAGQVTISAHIEDELGIKHDPLLYFATTDPGETPDVSRMIQVSMTRTGEGTGTSATFEARVPNPTLGLPPSTTVPLYYVISVEGAEGEGGCARNIESAPFRIDVRSSEPGEEPVGDGLCSPCAADGECGGEGDLCVSMGGEGFCLQACEGGCPMGTRCSQNPLTSVGGRRLFQCLPEALSCRAASGCETDDGFEPNDTFGAARMMMPGEFRDLLSCHGEGDNADDEDWYLLSMPSQGQIRTLVAGGAETDIDLALINSAGEQLYVSESERSQEDIAACVPPGDYYVRIYSYGAGENPYRMSLETRASVCDAACAPDAEEEDDDSTNARVVDLSSEYVSMGNTICRGDDDWYRVDLRAGQFLVVDVTFIMTGDQDDLDMHFMSPTLEDWTPCEETDPSRCSAFQGQSADSNEYYDHLVERDGTYYVVIHGFDGAENTYDLRLRLETPP